MSNPNLLVTRFAPSPTGHLHIGGARTALFCWAFAKGHSLRGGDGRFMIRIEDTDQARSSEASARGILEDLAWLGIHWNDGPAFTDSTGTTIGGDERGVGPFYQARRLAIYNGVLEKMIATGTAYPAFETSDELEVKRRAAVIAKRTYRYDRGALSIPLGERPARMKEAEAAGKPYVVRFKMPDEPLKVIDEVLGEVSYAAGEVEDFVIRKADGFPTYHFAVVVDDELMGVTHILRGQEHLNNTPKHVALQQALGYRTPKYAHMPLIFNMDGSKMSKRDKDKAVREDCKKAGAGTLPSGDFKGLTDLAYKSWLADGKSQLPSDQLELLGGHFKVAIPEIEVNDFRKAGYLPEVVCNFIALLGWSPGHDVEKFDMKFLAEKFDLSRIGKTNARFDRVKLLSFNIDGMTAMAPEVFRHRWAEWCAVFAPEYLSGLSAAQFELLAEAIRPRCKTFRDAAEQGRFTLLNDDAFTFDPAAVAKVLTGGEPKGTAILAELRPVLAALASFGKAEAHGAVESFCSQRGLNMGKAAQPLRVALTGGTVSPPIDAILAVLGKDRVLARIDRCLRETGA